MTYLIGFNDVMLLTRGLIYVWRPLGADPSKYKPFHAWKHEGF
jgi:hypothetical protein